MSLASITFKIACAGLFVFALSACTSSEPDNGKYSGTLGEKNKNYQLDTIAIDECQAQADSALTDFDFSQFDDCEECDSADFVTAIKADVAARMASSCKENGGKRDLRKALSAWAGLYEIP